VTIAIQAANSALAASAQLAVSNEPVCLASLDAQATTGVSFTMAAGLPAIGDRLNASWEPRQDLNWEDSSAYVLTYATFTDGAVMDVSTQVRWRLAAGWWPAPAKDRCRQPVVAPN
jgi:hypothetical protein